MPHDPRAVLEELVRRRHVASASAYVQTSTILLNRSAAGPGPWPEELPRHQDWELFRRISRRPAARWRHVDEPLVHVAQGSARSISAAPAWQASLRWLDDIGPDLSPGAQSDFLVHQVLRDALASGSGCGVRHVIARLTRLHRPGSARAWLVAVVRGAQGRRALRRERPAAPRRLLEGGPP
jgi:hypothetical protein